MIERKFEDAVGAKTLRFSHGHLCLVVEALDDAAGKQLLSPKVIEDQLAMAAEGAGDFFHGLDAGPHGLAAPFIEELAGPSRRVVVPELLKGFLEEVGADGLEVVAEDIAEAEALVVAEPFAALEQQPTGLLQDRIATLALYAAGFPARTSSRALFILATMWKRSRMWRASEHFSPMSLR